MSKVIFIDIDGPLIPMRAYFLPTQTPLVSVFDPCAVALLLRVVSMSQAQFVVSSTWGFHGYDKCMETFAKNGIHPNLFHKDWITPRKMSSSRSMEIRWWLEGHPEVTHHVAVDDEDLNSDLVANAALCDAYEGFSWRNYLECLTFLDAHETVGEKDAALSAIDMFKRREINRTRRRDEKKWEAIAAANQLFPPVPTDDES